MDSDERETYYTYDDLAAARRAGWCKQDNSDHRNRNFAGSGWVCPACAQEYLGASKPVLGNKKLLLLTESVL